MKCLICGQAFKPSVGHCSGNRWGGCCRSFRSNRDGDAHRVGLFENRRCRTDEELRAIGWEQDGDGYWVSPETRERAANVKARKEAGLL